MADDVNAGTKDGLGFIGVGVMGEAMCRNLARKSGRPVVATDPRAEPLERLAAEGVAACASVGEVAGQAEVVFLCLPSAEAVRAVSLGPEGVVSRMVEGQALVDCSTSPVALTREIAAACAEGGVDFADAPVARTRQAAQEGTLSIMVGGEARVFERLRPLLACMGGEITHCGPAGAGQVVKLMNNMVLFQTVIALAEALAVARRAGVDGRVLFETLAKGSADSFALRNHGMKSLLPGTFPEEAFSTRYALKDLSCALELAGDTGLEPRGARLAQALLAQAAEEGLGEAYFPAVIRVIEH